MREARGTASEESRVEVDLRFEKLYFVISYIWNFKNPSHKNLFRKRCGWQPAFALGGMHAGCRTQDVAGRCERLACKGGVGRHRRGTERGASSCDQKAEVEVDVRARWREVQEAGVEAFASLRLPLLRFVGVLLLLNEKYDDAETRNELRGREGARVGRS